MRFRFALLALPITFAAATFAACQGESEGMPCDPNAGDSRGTGYRGSDDCQEPLVCKTGLPNAQGARCCPVDQAQATTPECSLGANTNADANPSPPDSSTADGPSTSDGPAGDAPKSDGPAADGPAPEGAAEAGAGDASDGAPAADGPTE